MKQIGSIEKIPWPIGHLWRLATGLLTLVPEVLLVVN
jgi:hypothetical protein